jgi:hypothetical protein
MDVPEVIDRAALRVALEGLGIDYTHLRRVTADPSNVELTYLVVNEDGKPFAVGNAVAEVTYTVPILNTGRIVHGSPADPDGGFEAVHREGQGVCCGPA